MIALVLGAEEQAHQGEVWANRCPDLWQSQPFQVAEVLQPVPSLISWTWVA